MVEHTQKLNKKKNMHFSKFCIWKNREKKLYVKLLLCFFFPLLQHFSHSLEISFSAAELNPKLTVCRILDLVSFFFSHFFHALSLSFQ